MSGEVKSVPVEPTEEMVGAGGQCQPFMTPFSEKPWTPGEIVAASVYRAMLAAAPSTQPEPVAWRYRNVAGGWTISDRPLPGIPASEPLFASPLQAVRGDGPPSPKSEDTHRATDRAVLALMDRISDLCTSFNEQMHDADDVLGQINQLAYGGIATLRPDTLRAEAATPDASQPLPAAPEGV